MQGIEILYVVLAVAFVVPCVIAWRSRLLRLEAHIEVPPEDPADPHPHVGPLTSLPPSDWTVSDPKPDAPPVPLRAASLTPIRSPSQQPVTISDGSSKPIFSLRPNEKLPVPVRRVGGSLSVRPVHEAVARISGLPIPLRTPEPSDEQ